MSQSKKLLAGVESVQTIGKIEDHSSLLLTLLISKLHLCVENANHVTARQRSACVCVTILFFISIDGISPISKRNVVLDSIANIFLVLNKDT